LRELPDLLTMGQIQSCLLVADHAVWKQPQIQLRMEPALERLDRVIRFSRFTPNPTVESVESALSEMAVHEVDAVVALGGGTAIDIAKLVSVSLGSGIQSVVASPDQASREVSLIAIPTTAGTGSEVTHFAVLYIDGVKQSIANEVLRPDIAIVDPDLLMSVPTHVAAHTGLDALCQCIESIWSINANAESTTYARDGLRLALEHLEQAVKAPDAASRDSMARAAHLSGKAIDISKTTAAHALSYAMTSYHGIPHGLAVALTIGPMLEWNAQVTEGDCTHPEGVDAARSAVSRLVESLSCPDGVAGGDRIDQLIRSIGCDIRLGAYGIDASDIERLSGAVNTERLGNNPRSLGRKDIERLLMERL